MTEKVHLLATEAHYLAHLKPIWSALPDDVRGVATGSPSQVPRGGYCLVASAQDARSLPGKKLIHVDHGAGQTYRDAPEMPNYPGGGGLGQDVALFLSPRPDVAERWLSTYVTSQAAAIGCPKLDRWFLDPMARRMAYRRVAVSFHWDAQFIPEASSALPHFQAVLGDLRDAVRSVGGDLLGHAHPRAWRSVRWLWEKLKVPSTPDLDEVFATAALFVADNTSAIYEAAAIDIPVVVLNAPQYRRHVEHGLRFWSHIPGPQVDEPEELVPTVLNELVAPQRFAGAREAVADYVYGGMLDGLATARAVEMILHIVKG